FTAVLCSGDQLKKLTPSSPVFRLEQIAIASSDKDPMAFRTDVPSSSQMPQRITIEDLRLNRHLTKLNREGFLSAAGPLLTNLRENFDSSGFSYIILNTPVPELSEALKANICNSDPGSFKGSAGSGIQLLNLIH